ncbi:putative aspartic-type endopeptidase [Venturia nashicola]|nr:putative aspartic-type endopeptidase [Venturia nashicola]
MLPSFGLIVTTLTLVCGVFTSPTAQSAKRYALKSTHHVPQKWDRVAPAPPNHMIRLQIGLRQGKADEVLQNLKEVSDPRHPRYGQHLSNAEVVELVRPTPETSQLVNSWLNEHGIGPDTVQYSPAGDWLSVSVPVYKANRLLGCHYSVYEHQDEKVKILRTQEWSLPEYLHDHIDLIEPTNSFIRPLKREARSTAKFQHLMPDDHADFTKILAAQAAAPNETSVAALCETKLVTPNCLRALYGTINYTQRATGQNRMAIANYLDQVTLKTDLDLYLKTFRPDVPATASDFKIVSYDNGTTQQTPLTNEQLREGQGQEGNLDVQTMIGIAYPVPLISYSTGGQQPGFKPDNSTKTNDNEPYLAWVTNVLALGDNEIPYVISTSYADNEQTVSREYAEKVCQAFATLGTRGVSLLFGSGDEGVGRNGNCLTNSPPYKRKFLPKFPSSCPWITSVGATYKFNPEIAAYDGKFKVPFTSGSGFSDYFERPGYQEAAVSEYLSKNANFSQYASLFNPLGRAYPDIAAQGNYSIVWNSHIIPIDGTSAATPAAAAIIALVNDALLDAGKNTLGFLNPWLYQGGYKAFNDIVNGSADGCEVKGFTAGPGWDAVTGFGTPDFPRILNSLGITSLD